MRYKERSYREKRVQTADRKQKDFKERKVLIEKSQIMETWLENDTFRSKMKLKKTK
jgi:hypothetical protein